MALNLHNALVALGQLLLGGLFVYAGINHFFIAEKVAPMIAVRGVPYPHLTLYVGSAFQTICGACLMLGIAVVPAALASSSLLSQPR